MKVVLSNCPPAAAEGIARALVERRLAACVNIIQGVRSIYWWEGEVQDEAESTLLIKVRAQALHAMKDALIELHPYEVPEVVVLPVEVAGSHGAYVEWVRSLRPA
jgi:periplasmic divalent cation tolerance protein